MNTRSPRLAWIACIVVLEAYPPGGLAARRSDLEVFAEAWSRLEIPDDEEGECGRLCMIISSSILSGKTPRTLVSVTATCASSRGDCSAFSFRSPPPLGSRALTCTAASSIDSRP